VNDVVVEVGP